MLHSAASRIKAFVMRQKHNYRVGVGRASLNSLLNGLTSQYSAIFAVGLGANAVQLGLLSSIGGAVSALISLPVGWLIDRRGVKRFALLSVVMMAASALLYAIAQDWRLLGAAAVLVAIGNRFSMTGNSVICADSVQNRDRVTAQNVCGTLSSVVSMIAPLLGAYVVTLAGGMTVQGIRPLYYIRFVGYGLVFLLIATMLREPERRITATQTQFREILGDYRKLFFRDKSLVRWIILVALTAVPMPIF